MGSKKTCAILLVALFLTSIVSFQPVAVKAQQINNANSPPSIEWQRSYGDNDIWGVSNIIQTTDSGYAFVDSGWLHSVGFHPATVYKVDSSGGVQWKQTIYDFEGSTVLQTSDNGFEISGHFIDTEGTFGGITPTLPVGYEGSIVKMDSTGNIKWAENYTNELPNLSIPSSTIQTDDSVFSLQSGSITKVDSNGTLLWQLNSTFTYFNFKSPLQVQLSSLIETSDGSIAALGVGTPYNLPQWDGNIYLIKTEPFLPVPLPTQQPTPIPTANNKQVLTTFSIAALAAVVIAGVGVSLVLLRRHRKTTMPINVE